DLLLGLGLDMKLQLGIELVLERLAAPEALQPVKQPAYIGHGVTPRAAGPGSSRERTVPSGSSRRSSAVSPPASAGSTSPVSPCRTTATRAGPAPVPRAVEERGRGS